MDKKAKDAMMTEEKGTKAKRPVTKAVGTGNTRMKFDEHPEIDVTADAKKKNPRLQMELFGKDALGSEIGTTADYAAGSKKGFIDKGVFEYKSNEMNPTENY